MRRARAQSLVELALVAPLLIMMAMAVWDGGSVLRDQVVLQQAARDGARIAATTYGPVVLRPACPVAPAPLPSTVAPVAQAVMDSAGDLPGLSSGYCYPDLQSVRVTVQYQHPLITPVLRTLWSEQAVPLQATATFYLPGAASKLAFWVQPSNALAGASIAPAVQVTVQDAFGNTVPNSVASISVAIGANPGGGALSGTTPLNAANGVATFSNLAIDMAGVGYTLIASSSGLTGATSAGFTITGLPTATALATPVPTSTSTQLPTATPIPPTVTPTPTATLVPPTATPSATPVPLTATPTRTATPMPPTVTPVPATATPVPPTATPAATPTATAVPPTATPTLVPPTMTPAPTATPVPPTATLVPTMTPVPPTATRVPTATPVPPTATPVETVIPLDDPDSRFVYTGPGWQTNCTFLCPTGNYAGTLHFSATTGDTATILLYGDQFDLYTATLWLGGIAGVAIDGGAETNVDLYASTFPGTGNMRVWGSGPVPWGWHTLTIRNTGTRNTASSGNYISIDRLTIWTAAVPVGLATPTALPTPTPLPTGTATVTPLPTATQEGNQGGGGS